MFAFAEPGETGTGGYGLTSSSNGIPWTASLRKSYPHLFRPLPWSDGPAAPLMSSSSRSATHKMDSPVSRATTPFFQALAPQSPNKSLPPQAQPQPLSAEVEAFSSLLAYDPKAYAAANGNGYRYALRDTRLSNDEREVVPLNGDTGIAGKARMHVLHELHRLRNAKSTAKRKNLAALAGVTTIIVTGATSYMIVCDIISLIRAGRLPASSRDGQRTAFLIAALVNRSVCLVGQSLILLWCRYARRPTPLARSLLLLALLCFLLQLVLSAINLMLILVWQNSSLMERRVRDRCQWGVDILWRLGQAGAVCPMQESPTTSTGDGPPWIAAGSVRLLVVIIVGTVWFNCLRLFCRSLKISTIVDPSLVPDAYIQSMLESHAANIVSLNDSSLVARTAYDPSTAKEYLPPMPERRRLLRTEDEEELDTLRKREASWSGTFWHAVAWLTGNAKYQGVKERPESIYSRNMQEKEFDPDMSDPWSLIDERRASGMASKRESTLPLVPKDVGTEAPQQSWGAWARSWFAASSGPAAAHAVLPSGEPAQDLEVGPRQSISGSGLYDPDAYAHLSPFANNPLHPDYIPPRPMSSASLSVNLPLQQQAYKDLFTGIHGRRSTPSPAVTSPSSTTRSPPKPLPQPPSDTSEPSDRTLRREVRHYGEGSDDSEDSFLLEADALANDTERHFEGGHGRAPSGSVVYIRMSDGRLVRKLSTIHSVGDDISRDASLASLQHPHHSKPLPGTWRGSE